MSINRDTPIFEIGTTAARTGVAITTIRTWEDRYGLINPHRNEAGRRLYSEAEIETIRTLGELVDQGLRAGEAHRLLQAQRRGTEDRVSDPTFDPDHVTPAGSP